MGEAGPLAWVVGLAGRFKTAGPLALAIAAVNLAGIAYGMYYYAPQFARTPIPLWPFAPDTPLAVLWAELALAAYWLHRWRGGAGEPPGVWAASLDALAFVGNLQVGLWTVFVLVRYADAFGTFALSFTTVLLVSHAGMVLLSLVFLAGLRARFRVQPRAQALGVGVAAAFYLAQDAMDYFGPDFMGRGCGMRPHTVPCEPRLETVLAAVTFALTILSVALLVLAARVRGAGAAGR